MIEIALSTATLRRPFLPFLPLTVKKAVAVRAHHLAGSADIAEPLGELQELCVVRKQDRKQEASFPNV
jgi:hypothetical protein